MINKEKETTCIVTQSYQLFDGFFLKLNDASILRLKIRLLLILHPSMTKIIAQKEKKIKII